MKKLLILITVLVYPSLINSAENCESKLSALKPSCNAIGKGFKNLKEFSSKNQTIGQSMGIEKGKGLRDISENNKTLDQTFKNVKDKLKKK